MNAPSTFQSTMNSIFRPLLRKHVFVFFDDTLVYSPSWQFHLTHLEEVLTILTQQGFLANRKKCVFGQSSIDYLGHIISARGMEMDPSKVQAVLDWPVPKDAKGVRGFLGLTGYYRQFIKDYGKIAQALSQLTK